MHSLLGGESARLAYHFCLIMAFNRGYGPYCIYLPLFIRLTSLTDILSRGRVKSAPVLPCNSHRFS